MIGKPSNTKLESWNNLSSNPANIYMLKVNNRNIRTRGELYSKLTIETLEQEVNYVQS